MALHFSANQYDIAYKPSALGNWEVPKTYDKQTPKKRTGRTQIISNNRGHLLPGYNYKPGTSAWGHYVGTWHMPNKIDRKAADILNGTYGTFKTCEEKRLERELKKKEEERLTEETIQNATSHATVEAAQAENVSEEKKQDEEGDAEMKCNKENIVPYVPGDLTEEKYRPDSYNDLVKERFLRPESEKPKYPRYRDDFDRLPENCNGSVENSMTHYQAQMSKKPKKKLSSPIVAAISNFNLAKKLHKENLEHEALPDTVTNSMYRKLQMERAKEPGLALEEESSVTGIGWKGHPGYGPTKCTKLKVYRPKTGIAHQTKDTTKDIPGSISSFDMKWRFIRQRKVSPIELAICWDLTPENPKDEPKRTPHIDGSNGSMAPAVFSLVHTPKDADDGDSAPSSVTHQPLFDKLPHTQKHFVLDRPKSSMPCLASNEVSVKSEPIQRSKSAYNLHDRIAQARKAFSEQHQSTPNLSQCGDKACKNKKFNTRLCMACEMKRVSLNDKEKTRPKEEFKMAFKAGVPQNYKGKREDYPEHWRLATVYQHSYKPIQTRKRPLLATVFK